MWRGATLDLKLYQGDFPGPVEAFSDDYGVPLHIYRTFKTPTFYELTAEEEAFARGGGILFYSVQPDNWTEYARNWPDAPWDRSIENWARTIKTLAPHKVMIAPGYEPDGHAVEFQNKTHEQAGHAAAYRSMFLNFKRVFSRENVTNALFVLDFSVSLRDNPEALPALWPGNDAVDWLFFNLFESQPFKRNDGQPGKDGQGNCSLMLSDLYHLGETLSNASFAFTGVPWGLGAWGSMNQTFGDPPKWPSQPIPLADRQRCIQAVHSMLADKVKYPRFEAAIYFNSLNSLICPRKLGGGNTPELAPTLKSYFELPAFTAND